MKQFIIDEQSLMALINYLSKRPYEEVAGAISALQNLKEVKGE
jgi:hypothetical protein